MTPSPDHSQGGPQYGPPEDQVNEQLGRMTGDSQLGVSRHALTGMDADHKRRAKAGLSQRMKAEAEHRRCPSCGRKSAISTHRDGDYVLRVCRWCGYEKGGYR